MSDKDVEKQLTKALNGLKAMQRDQEEKLKKRLWSECKVPFSLQEGLSKYTKYELDDIRKNLDIKNVSSLKKAELITVLENWIIENFEQIIAFWDTERFKVLTSMVENGYKRIGSEFSEEHVSYFRETGFVYSRTIDDQRVLAVPNELIEPIQTIKDNLHIRATLKRNTEWILLTRGILYYYGTVTGPALIKVVEKHTHQPIDYFEFYKVIRESNAYQKELTIDFDGYSNIRVLDPKIVKQEHKKRKTVSFYPFTKQQLLRAGEPDFVDRNKSYQQLVSFFVENFDMDKQEADHITEECVYATRIGHSPNQVLNYLSNIIEFDSMETVKEMMDHVLELMNNTREWFLKGHTSIELRAQDVDHLQPLPTTEGNNNNSNKVVKIGRNEPCPCGSGKKYKKCCGK